jgi:hypothetical protein
MGKLSKKIIIGAVKKETGLTEFDLAKFDGEYYWVGKIGSLFSESSTHYRTLNHPNVSLSRWVADFVNRVKEVEQEHATDIKSVIKKIDWNVEFE